MNRKIVQHGPATYTVSLPSEWVKSNKLKKGDEVEVEVSDSELRIFPNGTTIPKKIEIDASGWSSSLFFRRIFGAYTMGYDQIIVTSKKENFKLTSKTKDILRKELISFREICDRAASGMIGFEVLIKSSNVYEFREFASEKSLEFEEGLQQVYNYLELIIDCYMNPRKDSEVSLLNYCYELDNKIQTFCKLLQRMINKGNYPFENKFITTYSQKMTILSGFGDFCYYYLVHKLKAKPDTQSKDHLMALKMIRDYLHCFETEKVSVVSQKFQVLRDLQLTLIDKTSYNDPLVIMTALCGFLLQTKINTNL